MIYRKRIVAMLLSLILVLTMMPAMAFAEGEEAVQEMVSEETIGAETVSEDEQTAGEETVIEEYGEVESDEPEESVSDEPGAVVSKEDPFAENDSAVINEEEDSEEVSDEVIDESDMGYEDYSFSQGIDPENLDNAEGAETDELMDEFFMSDTPAEPDTMSPVSPKSVKGDRLTGNSLKFYNYFKGIIKTVSAANTSASYMSTSKKVKLSSILGKSTYTAKQLGVSKIGYKKNGKWYVSAAAKKKIEALVSAPNWDTAWKKVSTSVLSDLSSESYWVDWYSNSSPDGKSYQFIVWNCSYSYNETSLTFKASDTITFRLPVIKEFKSSGSSAFRASTSRIKAANTAKSNAKAIVKDADYNVQTLKNEYGFSSESVDIARMMYYCEVIADLNTYNHEAADTNANKLGGPWSMIDVFDGNTSTNALCAGYARAFKYLCDLSKFEGDWVDCQIVTGPAGGDQHMWNIVRMYDGLNYLVDPTWIDGDGITDNNFDWFLRGDPDGTSNGYTIDGYYRKYDDWVKATFAPAERKLSTNSYYNFDVNTILNNRPIVLRKPAIKTPVRGKKKITVKWAKVSTPLGAMYVDGYQIRYSTKSSMSSAKIVTVKGYNKSSAVIKKLKSNKYYYVQVRTYAKTKNKTYHSKWSTKKKVKTK